MLLLKLPYRPSLGRYMSVRPQQNVPYFQSAAGSPRLAVEANPNLA